MSLGSKPLNSAPLGTFYRGVTYNIETSIDGTWEVLEYAITTIEGHWTTDGYISTVLESSWGSIGQVTTTLSPDWSAESYALTVLNGTWNVAYQNEITTSSAYCLKPVRRVKVVERIVSNCECEEEI
jgi:hypothetical protein